MAGGQHHALAEAELHLARREVGDHDGQLAFEVGGLVGGLDAAEDIAGLALADVKRQAQQLVGAFDVLGLDDLGDAQVDLSEVVDLDLGRNVFTAGDDLRRRRRLEQRLDLAQVHALHQVLVGADLVAAERAGAVAPLQRLDLQEGFDLLGQRRQHRLQVDRQQPEGLDADAADIVQGRVHAVLLGQFPGLVLVDELVDLVGQRHDLAQGLAELAGFVELGDGAALRAQCIQQRAAFHAEVGAQAAVEALGQEAGGARGDVDELADQVAVDAGDEVLGVEVDVLDAVVQLGGDVVAQPFGVQAQAQVLQRVQPGTAALAHLLAAVDGHEAVHEDVVGCLAAAEVQHGRPEQRVEVGDVLADEVDLLGGRVVHEGVEILADLAEVVLQRR
mmetsp:Transcript_31905/g.74920  ORF Transcript_31905/g.74920 Transcript_31905/m.74920 type:complete len:389 (-) Transcript_31905:1741-2907(-)